MVDPLAGGPPGQAQTPPPGQPQGFDQRVYALVALIPAGRLATYGQIAELLGAYGAARQVGWALRRLPLPSSVPWQRVVNAQGRISMDPSRQGSDWMQRELLLAEGIAVAADGKLPLAAHRWQPAAQGPAQYPAPGHLPGPLGR
jgi:methylated-DNA-protein-cysteine methyltransferase-like protein